ncbi:MAG: aminotransferase class IV [Pseudomonadota bacterium]
MGLGRWVFLNDSFVEADAALISPFDRGFLFAHAAYEVTSVYNGQLIDFDLHMNRLKRTMETIEIEPLDLNMLAIHEELLARNETDQGLVYVQVSAGNQGPRDFYGPENLQPALFMFATEKPLIGDIAQTGITAVTCEDTRWKRCDVKTTQLLSQSLAYRSARRAGAFTAIMHEDGLVTEAASANAWIVKDDGTLITRNLSPSLLPGITRERVMQLVRDSGHTVEERPFSVEEALSASEMFTTSTGVVVLPVTEVDSAQIGDGRPGPVTRTVQRLYYEYIGADTELVAPWAVPA